MQFFNELNIDIFNNKISNDYLIYSNVIYYNIEINDKYFIIHKYSPDDIKKLKKSGELTSIINVNENNEDYNDNDNDSVHVLFDEDVLSKVDEIEINDDFIASI